LSFVGTTDKKREWGEEQRLATARNPERRGRALVSALHRALRKPSSPRKRAFYPPKTSGETCPLEEWVEANRAKKNGQ
jgi:hypothetical protein